MNRSDTICGPASAVGGAIAVIRIAGPRAIEIGNAVWRGSEPLSPTNARKMLLGRAGNDHVLAVCMPAPASYTGDDVVELHCHGGAAATRSVLRAALEAGCRMAEPGEFTCRAFLNGKLDLVKAEAVAEIVAARSDAALRLAERQLAGSLSRELASLRSALVEVLAECESHLDFPDEELDWEPDLAAKLAEPLARAERLAATAHAGEVLREGVRVVIAGRPNVGKSSLMNRLLGYDRAIVTAIPGTTRDTLEETLTLAGIPIRLTDTAGLREGGDDIEQLGIERSRRSLAAAEVVFLVLDASADDPAAEWAAWAEQADDPRLLAIWNKIDLVPGRELPDLPVPAVRLSTLTGEHFESLGEAFRRLVWGAADWREPELAVNARHAAELAALRKLLPEAAEALRREEWEIAAIPLRAAVAALDRITGEAADPDLLERIFSRFCIGK